eukprot:CAMPEP_0119312986 /NCGR_PEP_ID=MMETSP1333-20130426/27472_1 /TAXON_ID=418940 /ORGANISM="Scyphosphaera apsteinii, Strain RCC1455" /LENGTH=144 /DNA_ID=CAMNT_0007317697 /DNA_START=218 /DNA_END=653 /DNA_ORIENTATION=-
MQFRAVAAAHSGTSDANWETRCKAVAQLAEQNDANNREAMQRIEQHMELHSKQQKAKQTAAPRQHHQGSHTSIRVQAAPGGQSSFKLVDGSAIHLVQAIRAVLHRRADHQCPPSPLHVQLVGGHAPLRMVRLLNAGVRRCHPFT